MHTPGPWKIVQPPQVSRRVMMPDDTVEVRAPQGGMVACLYAENFHEADEANARLIAAAPDMLEALQTLVPDEYGARPTIANLAAARAAIAKATGGE